MLDHNELRKYFTKAQQQDMIQLDEICARSPPGRIRRPRIRKPKPGHIPRPVNSFMSYRTEKQSIIRKFCPTANHREISKIVAKWWHNATHDEKSVFISKAAAAKDAHAEKYPDYIFRPKAKKSRKASTAGNLDSKKPKEEPFCTLETPFSVTGIQEKLLYEDTVLFGENDNLWGNTQDDYAYTDNQLTALTTSQYYQQYVPQYSMLNNQTGNELDVNLGANYFDLKGQQYLSNNVNSSNCAFPSYKDLQHLDSSQLCPSNTTPNSQSLETPLLDYFQSPATRQAFDSSPLAMQNTLININTPFQMGNYYKLFSDPDPDTDSGYESNNRLLFNDSGVWS